MYDAFFFFDFKKSSPRIYDEIYDACFKKDKKYERVKIRKNKLLDNMNSVVRVVFLMLLYTHVFCCCNL